MSTPSIGSYCVNNLNKNLTGGIVWFANISTKME